MLVYLIALAIVFVVSFISFFVVNKSDGQLKNMRVILIFLLFTVLISAGGLLSKASSDSMSTFFMVQVFCLVLGYVSSFLMKKEFFGQMANEKVSKTCFVLANATAGMIGFTMLFNHFNDMGLAPYYSLSAFSFVLPQFFATSFEAYTEIPQEIFKVWYYPEEEKEIDFDKIDTSKIFMLEMEFSKSISDNKLVNSKAKAPLGMGFGDWFMSFIENYNHKFDNDPIQYLNADNTPNGWIFYVKPSFFGGSKYIDPDLSIADNKLSEKNVIIARRVAVV